MSTSKRKFIVLLCSLGCSKCQEWSLRVLLHPSIQTEQSHLHSVATSHCPSNTPARLVSSSHSPALLVPIPREVPDTRVAPVALAASSWLGPRVPGPALIWPVGSRHGLPAPGTTSPGSGWTASPFVVRSLRGLGCRWVPLRSTPLLFCPSATTERHPAGKTMNVTWFKFFITHCGDSQEKRTFLTQKVYREGYNAEIIIVTSQRGCLYHCVCFLSQLLH